MTVDCDFAAELADCCKSVINSPEKNLSKIERYVSSSSEITMLSMLKIFKNIIPLYKINIIEDKVKHSKEYIKLMDYDKNIYKYYKIYVNNISRLNTRLSYTIAVELLENFDHFNFAEKILNKILQGTKLKGSIAEKCVKIVIEKVSKDLKGELTFKVLIELLTFEYCPQLYQCICDLAIIKVMEQEYYEDEQPKSIDPEHKEHVKKVIKHNKTKISKSMRKMNTELAKIKKEVDFYEKKGKNAALKKMYKTIVDNLLRIFFIILKEKKTELYVHAFIGINKYKTLINKEFYEGMIIMLNESMLLECPQIRLYAASCYMGLFGDRNYEFRTVIECIYGILEPVYEELSNVDLNIINNLLDLLFIRKPQPLVCIEAFTIRILQFLSLRYSLKIASTLKKIISNNRIDIKDLDGKTDYTLVSKVKSLQSCSSTPFLLANILEHY